MEARSDESVGHLANAGKAAPSAALLSSSQVASAFPPGFDELSALRSTYLKVPYEINRMDTLLSEIDLISSWGYV